MKKNLKLILLSFVTISSLNSVSANDYVNYSGSTGILDTPNARIMPDWSMRMFYSKDTPYNYYGVSGTPLPFLEGNFHMTQINGTKGFSDSDGYGQYKDKSISFKLLLKNEEKYTPSVVYGAEDIWGTGFYTSKYIAMSKEIGFFDFTLGYALGRLGGKQVTATSEQESLNNAGFAFTRNLDWSGGKLFGSTVFKATDDLSLVAEYSPINYETDRTNSLSNEYSPFSSGEYDLPISKINYGLKYSLSNNTSVNLSYQRGNQLSFGLIYQFGFSRTGLYVHEDDPKWKANDEVLKAYENLDEKKLSDMISNEVAAEKMANVQTSVNENKIWIEFDNTRYDEDLQAVGRSISTVDEVAPKNYDTLYATLKTKDIPMKTIKVNRSEYDAFENQKVSADYFKDAIVITNNVEDMEKEFKNNKDDIYKTDIYGTQRFTYDISPTLRHYLNDKENPYTTKLSVMGTIKYDIAPGIFFGARALYPIYNTIQDINESGVLENNQLAVSSNMLEYYKYDNTQLQNLTLDYIFKTPYESISKIEIGHLDLAYSGTDLEWYKSFYDERFGFGFEYQYVYKRLVDDMLDVYSDLKYDAKFLNTNVLLSEDYGLHLGLKVGEFLAGDKGARIDFSRTHKSFTIGAFLTATNSNEVFSSIENKGYIDKGIYISFPLDSVNKKLQKGSLFYGLSPWTRDVGQFSGTAMSLYPMSSSENNTQLMKRDINKIVE